MKIKGFEKLSLVDYPHHMACVIFLPGCNFRCHYCYNTKLVLETHTLPDIPEEDVYSYIEKRKTVLEGIVVSGGEPTVHRDLPDFLRKLKQFGLSVKLDTNGTNPTLVAELIQQKLVDYIALDIKAPLNCSYLTLTRMKPDLLASLKQTLRLLADSPIAFELRTTVIPNFHDAQSWQLMREQVTNTLSNNFDPKKLNWYVQPFFPKNCLDPNFNNFRKAEHADLEKAADELKRSFPNTFLRG